MGEPHKKALQRCRAFLVQNMTFQDDILWDVLQTNDVISNIQVENIKARSPSNSRQVSAFLDHMLRRPRPDYDRFKEALKECSQDHCVDALEQEDGELPVQASRYNPPQQQPVRPSMVSGARPGPTGYDAQGTGLVEASTNLSNLQLRGFHPPAPAADTLALKKKLEIVKCPENPIYSTKEQYDRIKKGQTCYPMENGIRGRGLVITMTGNRQGWEKDVLEVAKMFKFLDVMPQFKFDLKEDELTRELETFACDGENACVDILFVVVMGHGGQWNNMEFLKTADSKAYPLRANLPKIFSNKVNPVLIDKPKIFILQMCRGADSLTGTVVDATKSKPKTQQDASSPDVRAVAEFSDYVIGYASQPGTTANRDIVKGTWYIQELTKEVIRNSYHRHFVDMLVEVNARLEHRGAPEERAQVAEPAIGLKKALYLFPGFTPTEKL